MSKPTQQSKQQSRRYMAYQGNVQQRIIASRTCDRVAYASLDIALRARSFMQSHTALPFHIYQCAVCGAYHLKRSRG